MSDEGYCQSRHAAKSKSSFLKEKLPDEVVHRPSRTRLSEHKQYLDYTEEQLWLPASWPETNLLNGIREELARKLWVESNRKKEETNRGYENALALRLVGSWTAWKRYPDGDERWHRLADSNRRAIRLRTSGPAVCTRVKLI